MKKISHSRPNPDSQIAKNLQSPELQNSRILLCGDLRRSLRTLRLSALSNPVIEAEGFKRKERKESLDRNL